MSRTKTNNYFRVGHETFFFDVLDLQSVTEAFAEACHEHETYPAGKDSPRPRISVFRRLSGHLARIHQIGDLF